MDVERKSKKEIASVSRSSPYFKQQNSKLVKSNGGGGVQGLESVHLMKVHHCSDGIIKVKLGFIKLYLDNSLVINTMKIGYEFMLLYIYHIFKLV